LARVLCCWGLDTVFGGSLNPTSANFDKGKRKNTGILRYAQDDDYFVVSVRMTTKWQTAGFSTAAANAPPSVEMTDIRFARYRASLDSVALDIDINLASMICLAGMGEAAVLP
jgi:hypothetical protein